jgi:hypothetical protein
MQNKIAGISPFFEIPGTIVVTGVIGVYTKQSVAIQSLITYFVARESADKMEILGQSFPPAEYMFDYLICMPPMTTTKTTESMTAGESTCITQHFKCRT